MKRLPLLFLIICGIVLSCKKEPDENEGSTANFTITGVRDADLTTNSTASFSFPVSITSSSGLTDNVSLSADGLPGGVRAVFSPASGTTPFTSRVTFYNDFNGQGGTYPVTITGAGSSGSRVYKLNVTIDPYRGWQFDDTVYVQTAVYKDPGNATRYPNIVVLGGGAGRLAITFAQGTSLPAATKTYKIASTTADGIQIAFYDEPRVYSATSTGSPTGTFTFDSLGKFIFKCSNVEVTDGLKKKILHCSFSE